MFQIPVGGREDNKYQACLLHILTPSKASGCFLSAFFVNEQMMTNNNPACGQRFTGGIGVIIDVPADCFAQD
jgi:hypothetical protein